MTNHADGTGFGFVIRAPLFSHHLSPLNAFGRAYPETMLAGYPFDPVMAMPASYGFAAVLPKPCEPADRLRLIKTVLSHRSVGK